MGNKHDKVVYEKRMLMMASLRNFLFFRRTSGFTLIELIVALALFSILMLMAVPTFTQWIRNTQIRSVAESLQHDLRKAKDRAGLLNRHVVLSMTNANPAPNITAAAGGINWTIQSIPLFASDPNHPQYIQGSNIASSYPGITIAGPTTLCFNSSSQVTANPLPGTGTPCTVPITPIIYTVTRSGATPGQDRPLAITVSLAGEIRMCDPNRSLALGQPDGC